MNLLTIAISKMDRFIRPGWILLILALLFANLVGNMANGKEGDIYLDEPEPVPPPTIVQRQKSFEEKYPDDTIRVQRDLLRLSNDRVVNDGAYVEFYRDGQKFTQGTYKMGVHHGEWKFWHPNGQLCKSTTFKDGLPGGEWEVFRSDGTRQASKSYFDGKRHGKWVRYYEDGEKAKVVESYKKGKLHGTRSSYYANGQKRQDVNFKSGVLHGLMVEWNESGEKTTEVPFEEGKVEGKLLRWGADGATSEETYREGKIVPSAAGDKELVPLQPAKKL